MESTDTSSLRHFLWHIPPLISNNTTHQLPLKSHQDLSAITLTTVIIVVVTWHRTFPTALEGIINPLLCPVSLWGRRGGERSAQTISHLEEVLLNSFLCSLFSLQSVFFPFFSFSQHPPSLIPPSLFSLSWNTLFLNSPPPLVLHRHTTIKSAMVKSVVNSCSKISGVSLLNWVFSTD